jgi:uncharacterized membrane protein YgaE (UPF0421/DUF939 family)
MVPRPHPANPLNALHSLVRMPKPTPARTGLLKQAVKTAAAALISLYCSRFLKLPEGYWAAISAIIVLQSDLESTLRASVNRLAGTAIGAVVGAGVSVYFSEQFWIFGLALMLAMLICALLDQWESYRFAGVTVAIVMLIPHRASPWIVGMHRFAEISLGIVVALAAEAISGKI